MALRAFKNIRWICGGLEKAGGVGALASDVSQVRRAYVIGREPESFARQLPVDAEICHTMKLAVQRAAKEAQPGDVVLLAPAAASQDQYDSFEHRGADFISEVKALPGYVEP